MFRISYKVFSAATAAIHNSAANITHNPIRLRQIEFNDRLFNRLQVAPRGKNKRQISLRSCLSYFQ